MSANPRDLIEVEAAYYGEYGIEPYQAGSNFDIFLKGYECAIQRNKEKWISEGACKMLIEVLQEIEKSISSS